MERSEQTIVRQRIDDWRRRLIDLSYRNRLINYRPTLASTLEIDSPGIDLLLEDLGRPAPWRFYFPPERDEEEEEVGDGAAAYVDEVVVRAAQHPEHPPKADEIVVRGGLTARRINRILENLARKSNSEFQDKALRILYVAAGFLDWIDPARDEFLSSPLVLVPVELRRETARHPYALYFVDDEEVTINPSLTEKLRRDLGFDIPSEWTWEDKPVATELDEIEQALAETGWSIRREAVLGLFSFQKFVMYRDLLDNEGQITSHPIITALAHNRLSDVLTPDDSEIPRLDELDDVQPPHTDLSVLDADATQRLCIEAAKRGESFVMQGPPGTGKSQTITNVIADAIGRGKRVLFVSEKAAALDVVHKRLAAEGLDEFCLLLHGEHSARREVVETLNRSLMADLVPRPGLTSHEFERLRQLRDLLNSTAQLVHLPMPQLGDRSLREVLGDLAQLHAAPSVPAAPPATPCQGSDVRVEFQQLDEIFQRIAERWHVSPTSFVWRDYAPERFTADEHGQVLAVVATLRQTVETVWTSASDAARLIGWPEPINARAVGRFLELGRHLEAAPYLDGDWLAPGSAQELAATAKGAQRAFEMLADRRARLAAAYPVRDAATFRRELPNELDLHLRVLGDVGGRTPAWDDRLLPTLPKNRRFLAAAPALIAELSAAAAEAAGLLGQPEAVTLARIRAIARLAALAFRAEDRPETEWLVRAGFERARNVLADYRESIDRYQSERQRLLESYEESVLELNAAELLRRFTTDYTSRFAKLRGAYRRDAKAIKAVRRDRKLPASLAKDLEELAELRALGESIDAADERLARALGSYAAGRETNVTRVDRALAVAEEVLVLAAAQSDLTKLGERLGQGSAPDAHIAQLSDRLEASLDELNAGMEEVRPLLGKADAVAEDASLNVLRQRLEALRDAVDSFAETAAELTDGSSSPVTDLATLQARAQLIRELHGVRDEIAARNAHWHSRLATYYDEAETNWPEVWTVVEWLARFEELVAGPVPEPLRAKLLDQHAHWPDFAGIEAALDAFAVAVENLRGLFDPRSREDLSELKDQRSFDEIELLCTALTRRVDDLYDWIEFRASRNRAGERGWGGFVTALVEREVLADDVVGSFRRAYWNRRLEELFEKDPDLADRGTTYARWIDEFRTLDRRLVRTGADRVIAARNRMRQPTVVTRGSQVELLKREAAKKRRHRPVRKLLAELPALLSELKPCLMMSPLTVSHFLAPTHQFDLVIFDEASQVPPQDAINCIYRGSQLIVAGDSRQLPPTPFFQVAESGDVWDEHADDASEDMESILDSCEALLPRHPLRWHYRSRHEDLIAFSNAHVYDRRLLTFPSADVFAPTKGVRFIHVPDAVYDRGRSGTNRREARVVAERVIAHLRDGRHSVGVIAFNVSQATAISEELDRLRIDNPDLEEHFAGDRLDAVFVKHLESVQGDERDVIVFSVGYGRGKDGKFTMNFGPLNKEGGYRRLNVAVTRGRDLVEVVSSVHAADFSLSETASRGAHLLQEYLRYAETGGVSRAGDGESDRHEFESALEQAIAEAIKDLGYEPVPEVGAASFRIGIAVRDPSNRKEFALGVETDGRSYRSAPTARDRDRLREEVLTQLKWRVHRIWSLDWVRNRQAEVERLREALQARNSDTHAGVVDRVEEERPERERTERVVEELRDALDYGRVPWVKEYTRVDLPRQRTFYEFHESVNRERQRDLLIQLLEGEAPIHVEYAIRRLGRAWGLERTGHRVRGAAVQAIKMAVRRGAAELRGEFLWLPDQVLTVVRSPCWSDERTFRAIHEIPPEEIDLAFENLTKATGATPGPELIAEAAKVLGFDRVGANIRDALAARLAVLVSPAAKRNDA